MPREGRVQRRTSETQVAVWVDLDGGSVEVATGIPFFDHMLDQLGTHGRIGLQVEAQGDLEIDAHHTVEDVGLALGAALSQALGDKAGIARYGDATVPMEEALAHTALDISGRPLLVYEAEVAAESIGSYDTILTEEFLQALARSGGLTLHVRLLYGKNPHHCVEAVFKSLARALALAVESRGGSMIPSSKGVIE